MEEMVEAIIKEDENVEYGVQKLRHDEDISILEITQQVDELMRKETEKGVPWKRGKVTDEEQIGKQQFQETDETTLLKVDQTVEDETIEKQKLELSVDQQSGVAWRRGKKTEPFKETEDSARLKVDQTEEQQVQAQEQPVAWKRGPKKPQIEQVVDTEETSRLTIDETEQQEVIQSAEEQPVTWRRGPKKSTPEEPKPEEQKPEEPQLPPWMRGRKPGPKREIPKPPEPEKVEQIALKPTRRQKKEIPKESIEEVSLKPVPKKPIVEEVKPEDFESVEIEPYKPDKLKELTPREELEQLEQIQFEDKPKPVEPLPEEPVKKPEEAPKEAEPIPEQPTWRRTRKDKPKEEVPEEKQWPTGKRRPLPTEPKEEVVLKPIPKPQKETEPLPEKDLTIKPKPLPELPDKPDKETEISFKPLPEQPIEIVPVEESPAQPAEDDESHLPPWRRGKKAAPKREIPPPEPEVIEKVTLKPTPRQKKEISKESLEEVSLKPVPKKAEVKEASPEEEQVEELKRAPVKKPREISPKEELERLEPLRAEPIEQPEVQEDVQLAAPIESEPAEPMVEPEQPTWRRTKKPKPVEEEPEEKKWPTGKRKPLPEQPKEEIILKPIPKKDKVDEPKPADEPSIEPTPIPEIVDEPKEEEVTIEPLVVEDDSHLPPWRRGKKPVPKREIPKPAEPEAMEQIKLKPTSRVKKDLPKEALEEVTLKPVPKQPEVIEAEVFEPEVMEVKEVEITKPKKTKQKRIIEPLEKPAYPEIPEPEPVVLDEVEKVPEEVVKPEEPTPEQPSWRRTEKPEPVVQEPEEKKWPTGKRRPLPEEPKEEVVLKPIPKPQKEEEPKPVEEPRIKPKPTPEEPEKPEPTPWRRGKKEKPAEEPEDTKEWPKGKRRPLEEAPKEEVVLKPIPKPKKEEEPLPVEEPAIKLKPVPTPEEPEKPEPTPWRRGKKEKPVEEPEEVKEWPKGKRRPLEEEPKEEVILKPIPKPQKEELPEPVEEPKLKPKPVPTPEEPEKPEPTPWRRGKKEKPSEEPEEVKEWPKGKRHPLEEQPKEEVILKPIPKPQKEEEPKPVEEPKLKPKPVPTQEEPEKPEPTPWKRGQKEKPVEEPEDVKEWPKGKRRPLEEQPKEEITLKPIPKATKEEEPQKPEPVELEPVEKPAPTPWRRGKPKEKPQEPEPMEEIKLKPTPKRAPVQEEAKEEVVLKPVPKQEAIVEDIPKAVELKPIEDKKEPVEIRVEIEEQIVTKTKRRVKRPKKPQEQFATESVAPMEEVESFDEDEELPHVAETVAEIVPEEVLELIPEEVPLEKPKKRKSRTNKHVVFKEELSTYEIQPEVVQDEEEEEEEEEIQQEVSQKTIQLKPTEVTEVKPQPVESIPIQEIVEEQSEFRKEMEVKIQSNIVKKEKRRVFVDDSQPLPELEIITQKRVQEVTDKVAEENVREEQHILESVQQTIAETKIQEQKIKIKKQKVQPPNFIEKLQPQICEPNQPVLLQCKIEGIPFPAVQWYFNDTVLFANPEYIMNIVEDVATLEIATVMPYHVGVYTCEAKNVAGIALSKANIVVQAKPEVGEAPTFITPLKISVNEDKSVATVTCQVHGIPKPKVRYFRDEEEIVEIEEIETVYIEETGQVRLTVKKPKQNVPVVYTIQAENKFGKAVGKANLFIQSIIIEKPKVEMIAPKIVEPLQAQVVKTGSTLVFECRFTGMPKPTVKWFRNSKEVVEEEEVTIVTEEYYSKIVITRMTKKRTGKYEIVVFNEAGEAKSSASVAISDTSEMDEAKAPRFVEPLTPKLVAEAEVCILEALVDSYPTSTFQWFREGAAIKSSNELRIVTDENKSILIIESFNRRDVGAYTCRAENVAGSVTSTATVQVLETIETEEVTEYISPRFIEPIKPTRVMDGEKLILACQVQAAPLPKVQWYHNEQLIVETKDKVFQQDSSGRCVLTVSEVFPEDTGEYSCVASNKLGEAICKTTVNVEPFEYVPDSEQFRSSEEDLLTDKSISTLEEYAEPIEYAPQIVKQLPEVIMSEERQLTKLEVKVLAQPKAQIRWLKANEEIIPSEEFQIENFEDGTSILVINDIYPDDSGTITFEAHNALGVATTTTELVVEEHVGSKAYRKPEWVTYMEEMKEALQAAYAIPSFSLEIKDSRAMLGERGYFECHFAGNPKPDILWYRNGKIVIGNERARIRTEEHLATLTIYPVEVEDFGFYKCRAMSEAGSCESYAKLIESTTETMTEEERTELDAQYEIKRAVRNGNGRSKVEKVEVVIEESEEVLRKKAERKSLRESKRKQKETLMVEEIVQKELESSVHEKVKFSQESSATLTTSTTSELTQDIKIAKDKATVKFKEHRETLIEEVVTTETVKEFERMVITEKLDVSDVESVKHSVQVNEILTNLKAADFGPGEAPLRELATIAYMVKHGVAVSEISSFYQSDHFPALKTPESQSALVLLLEREGYASIVTEILTETDMDETQLAATAGFRAFMRMIELNHASVEEIITHFSPEDFFMHEWKLEQADEKFEETRLVSSTEVRTTETTVMTKKELDIKGLKS
ncbi:titin-like [Armigeres subalbatus]|uniref:titin-like n=1 Tax=Armigeres subalbatus TaxID=124917 RepID=UPI002ED36F81